MAAFLPSAVVTVATAILILMIAFLVVVAAAGTDQRGVTHATDYVLYAGSLGTKMLIGQSVQVEGG